MKKRFILLIICILVLTQLSGCIIPQISSISNKEKSETATVEPYTLNKRQKQILKDEGLPTNYEELDISQKMSIEAIEDTLEYLENKYKGETFTYSGYVLGQFMDKEHLIANSDYGEVTVYRKLSKDKTEYEDDFEEVKAGVKCSNIASDFLSQYIDSDRFIITSKVSDLSKKNYVDDEIINNCNIGFKLFVNEYVGEKKFEQVIDAFSTYLNNNLGKNNKASVEFFLVKDKGFSTYLIDHFQESYCTQYFLQHKTYMHSSDGEEKIY